MPYQLSPVNEGDEALPLFEVLSRLGNTRLRPKELWSLCLQCARILRDINHVGDFFQTLCITPESVAFETPTGKICLLDLYVEAEAKYVPPEYEKYGNSEKSHLYSLGWTLLEASGDKFTNEEERSALSELIHRLTAPVPEERPTLAEVIDSCNSVLKEESSERICQELFERAEKSTKTEDIFQEKQVFQNREKKLEHSGLGNSGFNSCVGTNSTDSQLPVVAKSCLKNRNGLKSASKKKGPVCFSEANTLVNLHIVYHSPEEDHDRDVPAENCQNRPPESSSLIDVPNTREKCQKVPGSKDHVPESKNQNFFNLTHDLPNTQEKCQKVPGSGDHVPKSKIPKFFHSPNDFLIKNSQSEEFNSKDFQDSARPKFQDRHILPSSKFSERTFGSSADPNNGISKCLNHRQNGSSARKNTDLVFANELSKRHTLPAFSKSYCLNEEFCRDAKCSNVSIPKLSSQNSKLLDGSQNPTSQKCPISDSKSHCLNEEFCPDAKCSNVCIPKLSSQNPKLVDGSQTPGQKCLVSDNGNVLEEPSWNQTDHQKFTKAMNDSKTKILDSKMVGACQRLDPANRNGKEFPPETSSVELVPLCHANRSVLWSLGDEGFGVLRPTQGRRNLVDLILGSKDEETDCDAPDRISVDHSETQRETNQGCRSETQREASQDGCSETQREAYQDGRSKTQREANQDCHSETQREAYQDGCSETQREASQDGRREFFEASDGRSSGEDSLKKGGSGVFCRNSFNDYDGDNDDDDDEDNDRDNDDDDDDDCSLINEIRKSRLFSGESSEQKLERINRIKATTLQDIIDVTGLYFDETELWALCREALLFLNKERKNLPSDLSLDVLAIKPNGSLVFLDVPHEKPERKSEGVSLLAQGLQKNGETAEKDCIYGLGMVLRLASGCKNSLSDSTLGISETMKNLLEDLSSSDASRRPTLDWVLKVCESHEKNASYSSQNICQSLYEECVQNLMECLDEKNDLGFEEKNEEERTNEKEGDLIRSPNEKSAFVSVANNTRSETIDEEKTTKAPIHFGSSQRHFKPIVLNKTWSAQPVVGAGAEQAIKGSNCSRNKDPELVPQKTVSAAVKPSGKTSESFVSASRRVVEKLRQLEEVYTKQTSKNNFPKVTKTDSEKKESSSKEGTFLQSVKLKETSCVTGAKDSSFGKKQVEELAEVILNKLQEKQSSFGQFPNLSVFGLNEFSENGGALKPNIPLMIMPAQRVMTVPFVNGPYSAMHNGQCPEDGAFRAKEAPCFHCLRSPSPGLHSETSSCQSDPNCCDSLEDDEKSQTIDNYHSLQYNSRFHRVSKNRCSLCLSHGRRAADLVHKLRSKRTKKTRHQKCQCLDSKNWSSETSLQDSHQSFSKTQIWQEAPTTRCRNEDCPKNKDTWLETNTQDKNLGTNHAGLDSSEEFFHSETSRKTGLTRSTSEPNCSHDTPKNSCLLPSFGEDPPFEDKPNKPREHSSKINFHSSLTHNQNSRNILDSSRNLNAREILASARNTNSRKNLDSSRNTSVIEILESSRNLNAREILDTSRNLNPREILDSSRNLNAREILDTSRNLNPREILDSARNSNSRELDSSKNLNPGEILDSSRNLNTREILDSSRSLKTRESFRNLNGREILDSSRNTNSSKSLESCNLIPKEILGHPSNPIPRILEYPFSGENKKRQDLKIQNVCLNHLKQNSNAVPIKQPSALSESSRNGTHEITLEDKPPGISLSGQKLPEECCCDNNSQRKEIFGEGREFWESLFDSQTISDGTFKKLHLILRIMKIVQHHRKTQESERNSDEDFVTGAGIASLKGLSWPKYQETLATIYPNNGWNDECQQEIFDLINYTNEQKNTSELTPDRKPTSSSRHCEDFSTEAAFLPESGMTSKTSAFLTEPKTIPEFLEQNQNQEGRSESLNVTAKPVVEGSIGHDRKRSTFDQSEVSVLCPTPAEEGQFQLAMKNEDGSQELLKEKFHGQNSGSGGKNNAVSKESSKENGFDLGTDNKKQFSEREFSEEENGTGISQESSESVEPKLTNTDLGDMGTGSNERIYKREFSKEEQAARIMQESLESVEPKSANERFDTIITDNNKRISERVFSKVEYGARINPENLESADPKLTNEDLDDISFVGRETFIPNDSSLDREEEFSGTQIDCKKFVGANASQENTGSITVNSNNLKVEEVCSTESLRSKETLPRERNFLNNDKASRFGYSKKFDDDNVCQENTGSITVSSMDPQQGTLCPTESLGSKETLPRGGDFLKNDKALRYSSSKKFVDANAGQENTDSNTVTSVDSKEETVVYPKESLEKLSSKETQPRGGDFLKNDKALRYSSSKKFVDANASQENTDSITVTSVDSKEETVVYPKESLEKMSSKETLLRGGNFLTNDKALRYSSSKKFVDANASQENTDSNSVTSVDSKEETVYPKESLEKLSSKETLPRGGDFLKNNKASRYSSSKKFVDTNASQENTDSITVTSVDSKEETVVYPKESLEKMSSKETLPRGGNFLTNEKASKYGSVMKRYRSFQELGSLLKVGVIPSSEGDSDFGPPPSDGNGRDGDETPSCSSDVASSPMSSLSLDADDASSEAGKTRQEGACLSDEASVHSFEYFTTGLEKNSSESSILKNGDSGIVYHSADLMRYSDNIDVISFLKGIDKSDQNALTTRLKILQQQLALERKEWLKMNRFYHNLRAKDHTTSSKNRKSQIIRVFKDLQECEESVNCLRLCGQHLELLIVSKSSLPHNLVHSLTTCDGTNPLKLVPHRDNPQLHYHTISTSDSATGMETYVLNAGFPKALFANLYTQSALVEGIIHQFFYCFRYFSSPQQLFTFISNTYTASKRCLQSEETFIVQERTLLLLLWWIKDFFSVDFYGSPKLCKITQEFIQELPDDEKSVSDLKSLWALYSSGSNQELVPFLETNQNFCSSKKGSTMTKRKNELSPSFSSQWDLRPSYDTSHQTNVKEWPVYNPSPSQRCSLQGSALSIVEHDAEVLAEQLTLIEQDFFQQVHPVQFLNSKYNGFNPSLTIPGWNNPRSIRSKQTSATNLFVSNTIPRCLSVETQIRHAHQISHWVGAELISASSTPAQVLLLTKFLNVAQFCTKMQNFATGMAILDGLENALVRQLPTWKELSNKSLAIFTNLKTFKNSDCTTLSSEKVPSERIYHPVIPSILPYLLNVQQCEIGSFTLTNGMHKWTKMRHITRAIDPIRIFRQNRYPFKPIRSLQTLLQQRIEQSRHEDLNILAREHSSYNDDKKSLPVQSKKNIQRAMRRIRNKLKVNK